MRRRRAIATGCVGLTALVIVTAVVMAWIVMVVWGALALTFGFTTIGFGTAFLICIALSIVGSYFKSPVK